MATAMDSTEALLAPDASSALPGLTAKQRNQVPR